MGAQLDNRMARAGKGHLAEVDDLGGMAVLLVMLHRFWPNVAWLPQGDRLARTRWIGVDMSIVISGFRIGGILLDTRYDPHYFRNFHVRRSLRLFVHYCLFIVKAKRGHDDEIHA